MSEREPPNAIPRTFDRRVQFDERSRNFPVRALLAAAVKPRSYTWPCPVQLDQGSEGACVGFSVSHEAAAKPVCIPAVTDATARALYQRARYLDEWPGEDYEGTSVLAGVKAGNEFGWYPEYRWAFGLDDLILAVGHKGPAVLGVNWHEGQMDADDRGFIHVTGPVVGGHAILCRGVNVKSKYFTLRNSWGSGWGLNGDCRISFEGMDKLLRADGEACIPVRRAKAL